MDDLRGIRITSFFPWYHFEVTGGWKRFSSFIKFLASSGAEVTVPIGFPSMDMDIGNIRFRYFEKVNFIHDTPQIQAGISLLRGQEGFEQCSNNELEMMLFMEPSSHTSAQEYLKWASDHIAASDVVTVDHTFILPYIADLCENHNKPILATAHDNLADLHGSTPLGRHIIHDAEIKALKRAASVFTVSDEESRFFKAHGIPNQPVVNSGDAARLRPTIQRAERERILGPVGLGSARFCLFVGSGQGPNREAAENCKAIAKSLPESIVVVAGGCHPPVVEGNFAALGYVKEEMLDALYRAADCIIIPLTSGGGSSLKFFDAMAYGRATVTTDVGCRGHAITDGQEAVVFSSPAGIPGAVRKILQDEGYRKQLEESARQYGLSLDYRRLFVPYINAIRNLCGKPPAPAPSAPALRRPVVVADNNLRDTIGHHFQYAQAVADAAIQAQSSCTILAHRAVDLKIGGNVHIVPAFSRGYHEELAGNPYPPDWGQLRGLYDFLGANQQTFAEILAQGKYLDSEAVVFFVNAGFRELTGIALLLKHIPFLCLPRFVPVLRYPLHVPAGEGANRRLFRDEQMAHWYRAAFETLEQVVGAKGAGNLMLATDSDRLAREYGELTKLPIHTLPIPHIPGKCRETSGRREGRIRFGLLGDSREEKGFALVPGMVERALKTYGSAGIEFIIHAYISHPFHQKMEQYINCLRCFDRASVRLVERPLSPSEYEDLLAELDVVVLPYDSLTYYSRTSGPFVEAICSGKPVVCPRDTWMEDQLGNSLAGLVVSGTSPEDWGDAIVEMAKRFPEYREKAVVFSESYSRFHNPRSFLEHILDA